MARAAGALGLLVALLTALPVGLGEEPLQDGDCGARRVELAPLGRVCVLDRVTLRACLAAAGNESAALWHAGASGAWHQVAALAPAVPAPVVVPTRTVLRCASNATAADCNVELTAADRVNETAVVLRFSAETAMPDVSDAFALGEILAFTGDGWGVVERGLWLSPSALVLRTAPRNASADADADAATDTAPSSPSAPDSVTVRWTEAVTIPPPAATGQRRWFSRAVRLLASGELSATAGAPAAAPPPPARTTAADPVGLTVEACDDEVLVTDPSSMHRVALRVPTRDLVPREADHAHPASRALVNALETQAEPSSHATGWVQEPPRGAVFAAHGVVAVGAQGWRLPAAALPRDGDSDARTWSMCLWVWLDASQPHAGAFHTLFYKGTGKGQLRTPSAWFEPGTHRVSLHVSTDLDSDARAVSTRDLTAGAWSHLCFVFQNSTRAGAEDSGEARTPSPVYSVTLYINGSLDVAVTYSAHRALVSPGPLHIGRDPVHPGTRMLVAGLRLFDRGLSASDAGAAFHATAPLFRWVQHHGPSADPARHAPESTQPPPPGARPWSPSAHRRMHLGSAMHGTADASSAAFSAEEARAIVATGVAAQVLAAMRVASARRLASHAHAFAFTTREAENMTDTARELFDDCDVPMPVVVELLEDACAEGRGLPRACTHLARRLLHPGRMACRGEVRRVATMAQQYPHEHGDAPLLPDAAPALGGVVRRDVRRARTLLETSAARGDCEAVRDVAWLLGAGVGEGGMGAGAPRAGGSLVPAAIDAAVRLLAPARAADIGSTDAWFAASPRASNTTLASAATSAFFSTATDGGSAFAVAPPLGSAHDALAAGRAALTTGLLHHAAACGDPQAAVSLGRRYHRGESTLPRDVETALAFLAWASDRASRDYSRRGHQPFHETHRLTPESVDSIEVGQGGEDDELIEAQRLRAEQGDVAAMMAMGDLYYYGARGLPRDQVRARGYFMRAAEAGHAPGMSGAAGMCLRGEGGPQDNATALRLYEAAAEQDNVRALNGLGYMFFYGNGVPQNYTRAYGLFRRAAEQDLDGDSVFNAAHCVHHGLGTNASVAQARREYEHAARRFGHFSSIRAVAELAEDGAGGARDPALAAAFHSAAADVGEWGVLARRGFDHYRMRDYAGALLHYLHAWQLGDELGAANAAYLLHRRLAALPGARDPAASLDLARRLFELSVHRGATTSLLPLADFYWFGTDGRVADPERAVSLYARASVAGSAQAAYNLAHMHEYGTGPVQANEHRALRYYQRALALTGDDHAREVPVHLAMMRMQARRFLRSWGLWPERLDRLAAGVSAPAAERGGLLAQVFLALGDKRAVTERPDRDPEQVGLWEGDAREALVEEDAGSAVGGFRGQAASALWVADQVWRALDWEVRAGLLLTAVLAIVLVLRCALRCARSAAAEGDAPAP